jgi:nucleoside-diphosphate-sugar epimerase
MVRVLVTGANGYIGSEVAAFLARRGHQVYGLIRDAKHAKALQRNDVTPVIGSTNDSQLLEELFAKVSSVVDTVADYASGNPDAASRAILKLLQQVAERTHTQKHYVYTSGVLIYGDVKGQVVDETWPVDESAFRASLERTVVDREQHRNVHGTVIRPAWVYGKSFGNFISHWFKASNDKGEIVVTGNPDKVWPWIHVSDLADAYAHVIESGAPVYGEIFDVADGATRSTVREVREAWARAGGVKGPVVLAPAGDDPFSRISEASIITKSEKLRRLTGWQPAHGPLLDTGVAKRLYDTWLAHQA